MPNQSGGVIFSATTNAVGLVEEVISITEWSFGVLVNRDGNCLDMLVAPALPHRMGKLGLWSVPKPRNVGNIFRFIRLQAALATPARIGVITYKGLLEKIADLLPANVVARHFGALAGMNDMQDVAGLIVIGRPAPKWSDVEATASVFAGRPISSGEGHFSIDIRAVACLLMTLSLRPRWTAIPNRLVADHCGGTTSGGWSIAPPQARRALLAGCFV
jgi:hypothetical protein